METDHEMTCYLDLPGGRRVEVGMTVIEDPIFPTPGEPDVERVPMAHEWAEICGMLATMKIARIEVKERALKPIENN